MGIIRKTLYTEVVAGNLRFLSSDTPKLGIDTKIPVINAWQDRAVSSTSELVERSVLTRCEFGTDALTRWDRGDSVSAGSLKVTAAFPPFTTSEVGPVLNGQKANVKLGARSEKS